MKILHLTLNLMVKDWMIYFLDEEQWEKMSAVTTKNTECFTTTENHKTLLRENKVNLNKRRDIPVYRSEYSILLGRLVAQSVKHPTLNFSSGYDLTACGIKPWVRLHTKSIEPSWDSLSPSLCPSPSRVFSFSLSLSLSLTKWINKLKKKRFNIV